MILYHLSINSTPIATTFSPVEIVELIRDTCTAKKGEILVDIWTSEIK